LNAIRGSWRRLKKQAIGLGGFGHRASYRRVQSADAEHDERRGVGRPVRAGGSVGEHWKRPMYVLALFSVNVEIL
jgi:hypothetical protein